MFYIETSPEKSYVRYFKQFLTLNFPLRPMCLSPGFSSYLYSLNAGIEITYPSWIRYILQV
jgi:hypothetical protein